MKIRLFVRLLIFSLVTLILVWMQSCLVSKQEKDNTIIMITNEQGKGFQFELDFLSGKSHNYPLMAIWLEDVNGKFIQTLYVSRSVAKGEFDHADTTTGKWNSGPLQRPATLPYWAHKHNTLARLPEVYPSANNPIPDTYTGATPKGNFILKSRSDEEILTPFRVWFEINQFFDFNDFWTSNRFPEDKDYKTSGQPAIIFASDLIVPGELPVTFSLKPVGHSHYSGKDGGLYSSMETLSSAKDIAEKITVTVTRK